MSADNIARGIAASWAALLACSIAALYWHFAGMTLWLPLLVGVAIAFLAAKNLRMRAVDWSVLALAALEIPVFSFSQYPANSAPGAELIAVAVLFFFAIRLTIHPGLQVVLLLGLLGLGGTGLAVNALRQFAQAWSHLQSVGFSDPVPFRGKLIAPPHPWVLGEWLTVLLLLLPAAVAPSVYLWVQGRRKVAVGALAMPIVITAALILSLSRSVFWSAVLFYVTASILLAAFRVLSARASGLLLAATLGVLVLLTAIESALYPGVAGAYIGQQTSQIRSAQGRVEVWERSMALVRERPLWGVGSGNAALSLISSASQDETTGFAGRTFSLPVQLLVEKGVIGLCVYGAFLALVGRELLQTMRGGPPADLRGGSARPAANEPLSAATHRAPHRALACVFGAGLLCVLSRELTYSSLLEHALTLTLFLVLAALACHPAPLAISHETGTGKHAKLE